MSYSIAFSNQLEAVSHVTLGRCMRLIVPDKAVNFVIIALKVLKEFDSKPSEAAFSPIFFRDNFRPEVYIDTISGVVVDQTGTDIHVKFGDSRSNSS